MSDFNVIVIGAGPGGYVCALKAAALGLKTAVVEERDVGGTCLNRGCIPTKALLHASEVYAEAKGAEAYGVTVGSCAFDFTKMHEKKSETVAKLRGGIVSLFKSAGVTLLRGKGVVEGSGKVRAGETLYTADSVVIATGSTPARPPIPGLSQEGVITSDELLEGEATFDESLVIIGGGVIGVEFASVYARLGCRVTVIEALPRLLARMDKDLSQNLQMLLKKKGVKVLTDAMVKEIVRDGDGALTVRYETKGKEGAAQGSRVLVAIGRRPNAAGLFAPGVEVETNRGAIVVNDRFETSLPGVYAIGDVSSKIQLAHVASAQGTVVAEEIAGVAASVDLSTVPSCIYVSPEIGSVGLTEEEAAEQGYDVKTAKVMMYANGKTLIVGGERGFMKLVFDGATRRILGAHLMCERATDMISEFSAAIVNGLTVEQMASVIRPHPTFNEAVSELFEAAARL